jgi:hypothetical protein
LNHSGLLLLIHSNTCQSSTRSGVMHRYVSSTCFLVFALLTILELQKTSSRTLPSTTPPTRILPRHYQGQHLDYGNIKRYCECKLGIPSQCVQHAHVQKAQAQYISNVLVKFNARRLAHSQKLQPGGRTSCQSSSIKRAPRTAILRAPMDYPSSLTLRHQRRPWNRCHPCP